MNIPMLSEQTVAELEKSGPRDILAWAIRTFGSQIALACSFGGPSGMALLDMAMKIQPDISVFYLDTGYLFPETHELVKRASSHYAITPIGLRPDREDIRKSNHEALWTVDPDHCCEIRKVRPQQEFLSNYQAWITGIRRDQAATRKATPVLQRDKFGLIKVCPLVNWTERDVWKYINDNQVPYNTLHDMNYPSIGCTHCTRPVEPGEDLRAGRWSNFSKIECGLHTPDTQQQDAQKGTS